MKTIKTIKTIFDRLFYYPVLLSMVLAWISITMKDPQDRTIEKTILASTAILILCLVQIFEDNTNRIISALKENKNG